MPRGDLQALESNGQILGDFPLRVLPSKTAIVPVNTQYLPKTTTEREKCSRTIYAANIDKKVDRESVKLFFETLCGAFLRSLGIFCFLLSLFDLSFQDLGMRQPSGMAPPLSPKAGHACKPQVLEEPQHRSCQVMQQGGGGDFPILHSKIVLPSVC